MNNFFHTYSFFNGREGRIRTCDPLVPNQMRYQTAPLPVGGGARGSRTPTPIMVTDFESVVSTNSTIAPLTEIRKDNNPCGEMFLYQSPCTNLHPCEDEYILSCLGFDYIPLGENLHPQTGEFLMD